MECLRYRYGRTQGVALDDFRSMAQLPEESVADYADRLSLKAYGTGHSDFAVIHHFTRTVRSLEVKKALVLEDFAYLQQAVDRATRLERVLKEEGPRRQSTPASAPARPSTRRCYNCGSTTHLSAQCPKPKKTPPASTRPRARVQEALLEEESPEEVNDTEEAGGYQGCEVEEYEVEGVDELDELEGGTFECLPIVSVDAEKRRLETTDDAAREVRSRLVPAGATQEGAT